MKMESNKAFHPYGAQGAPRVNADVGSGNILATARTMDLPPQRNKGHEPRGNNLEERSQEQPMKMESNKAFHRTAHKAPPVNADVRIENIKIRLAADAA